MSSLKLTALAGSTRTGSYNRAILAPAVEAAREAGAEVTLIDLREYDLPLFSEDLEAARGLPGAAVALKSLLRGTDGFLLASPEHNSSYSSLLKNTIDWCSRAETDDEPPLACFRGKSALLLAASPGALGGLRGLYALRELLQNLQVTVHPGMLAVRIGDDTVDAGRLVDESWREKIAGLAQTYVDFAGKLAR